MERIPPRSDLSVIHQTMESLPYGIRQRLGHVHFVVDICPVWMGLSRWKTLSYGRSASSTSHVLWDIHQEMLPRSQREDTIVLQGKDNTDRLVILHELGHILDARLSWQSPAVVPLGDYAATDCWEWFATAFQSWLTVEGEIGYGFYRRDTLWSKDERAYRFFEQLAREG